MEDAGDRGVTLKVSSQVIVKHDGENFTRIKVPYILRYCWGVEVATFHHVLRSPWPWFHKVNIILLENL